MAIKIHLRLYGSFYDADFYEHHTLIQPSFAKTIIKDISVRYFIHEIGQG